MSQQSSPSRSTFEPHGTNTQLPTENVLAARRPSWTPSIPAWPELEARRTPNPPPRSKRRSRIHDENPTSGLSVDYARATPSLSRTRRPSFGPETSQRIRQPRTEAEQGDDVASNVLNSPEEGKGFRSSWEINVKKLVGDAVGNMSISPASRDIVLAARRGLFIIDLESRFSIPRFLPQGGTWDVADVQWNPHPSHAQYIVSTSNEKLLIWNLRLAGKTSIEHVLMSHYRAITDVNWHTTECDIVVSTGIDSWLWAWDLREPRKPIFGLSAFQSGGTQVKWNYQDGNLLASSHSNEVLIWDRRNGSLPITKIQAHTSKIYGIDWSRRCRNKIVTCSLDKTIKTWDINSTNSGANPEPKTCIQTTYPVWRARNLPFGEGILSLPQRGETTLEMYGQNGDLIETFEGHSDVVKEFVWRKGNSGNFQLITWSKDRTLRFWPIDAEVMHKVGHVHEIVRGRSKLTRSELEIIETFRNPPEGQEHPPPLSAPIGPRAILAEVRAPQPPRTVLESTYSLLPTHSPPPTTKEDNGDATLTPTSAVCQPIVMSVRKGTGGTMSKGGAGLKTTGGVDQLAWLASVKVGSEGKRESNSSGRDSGAPSGLRSQSRPPSGPERNGSEIGARQRSGSLSQAVGDERKDGDGGQSLQDEITSVLTKLAASKIELEKHDLTKRRTCTLGLHGPWGEKSSVFMRITFIFPREYPQASHPHGTPVVELERNPLINMRDRAFILKHLRRIRERKRPCLESCLRFLLFADEGVNNRDSMDSESSSDDDDDNGGGGTKSREITVSLLRNHKNLAEPRSSQGAFGPNGELISFFRAPPRIVRNVLRGLTNPSFKNGESIEPFQPPEEKQRQQEQQQQPPTPQKASYLRSPALVSDAVRRLGLAATDRIVPPIDPKQPETSSNILRAMTNLLTVPQPKARRDSETKYSNDDVSKKYAVFPTRRSIVFMTSTNNIAGADKKVAADYVFTVGSGSMADVCEANAVVARDHGRYDHERVFRTLKMLFRERDRPNDNNKRWHRAFFTPAVLAAQVITGLYWDYVKEKDVQMLAMLSMVVLQTELGANLTNLSRPKNITSTTAVPLRKASVDYFSLTKSALSSSSPEWPHLPSSPLAPSIAPSFSSTTSSRGSWSSLFNTGTVRQFMNGMQDSLKEGLLTPTEIVSDHGISTIATEKLGRTGLDLSLGGLRERRMKQESLRHIQTPTVIPKSWTGGVRQPSKPLSALFSSPGHRQHLLRFTESSSFINENQVVIFEPDCPEDTVKPLFDPQLIKQFKLNIYVYAELLFRWQLFDKRLELLKAVGHQQDGFISNTESHRIGLLRLCPRSNCRASLPEDSNICRQCNTSCLMPRCTICRFPIKGLSRTCLGCSHVTHISCWNSLDVTVPICPSGCGCFCTEFDGTFTRPSTRLGLTPPLPSMSTLP